MRTPKNYWLYNTPIAHRGLWGGEIVENSLKAYENAVNNGYPIEIDLFKTSDGKLVSFHDNTLARMTGAEGIVFEKTLSELKKLTLVGSNESIPTFKEVLNVVNGKVPLLIEIKKQPDKKIVESVLGELKDYKGEYAIQSFNPFYMLKVKKLAPNIIRGVLGTINASMHPFIIKHLPFNFLIKPDFISYYYGGLKYIKKKAKKCGLITWTVTNQDIANESKQYAQNIIFENFIPNE